MKPDMREVKRVFSWLIHSSRSTFLLRGDRNAPNPKDDRLWACIEAAKEIVAELELASIKKDDQIDVLYEKLKASESRSCAPEEKTTEELSTDQQVLLWPSDLKIVYGIKGRTTIYKRLKQFGIEPDVLIRGNALYSSIKIETDIKTNYHFIEERNRMLKQLEYVLADIRSELE